jgi:hypothetical protein
MELIMEYLQRLSVEQRDNVIEASEWATDGLYGLRGGARCLIGHAENAASLTSSNVALKLHGERSEQGGKLWERHPGVAYDRLVMVHGLETAVARIKAEAARLNDCSPEQIQAIVNRQVTPADVQ